MLRKSPSISTFLNAFIIKKKKSTVWVLSLQPCLCGHGTVALQAPLSMEFSRQEHWRGLPWPPPGDLPNSGTEPTPLASPALAGGFFTTWATWEALDFVRCFFYVDWDDHILLFCFVNVAYDTDGFSILNHLCTYGAMNPAWSLCIILLIWHWTQFSSVFLRKFSPVLLRDVRAC